MEPAGQVVRQSHIPWKIGLLVKVLAALLVGFCLSGCAAGSDSTADCADVVRMEGVIYIGSGITEHQSTPLATAELAHCDDQGADAEGINFPSEAEPVDVVSFPGQDDREVVGLPINDSQVTYLIREGLDSEAAEAIRLALDVSSSDR